MPKFIQPNWLLKTNFKNGSQKLEFTKVFTLKLLN